MGKAKKRNFDLCKKLYSMSLKREDAIKQVIQNLNASIVDKKTKDLLSLFGIKAEELTENGASWEELKRVEKYVS